MRLDRSHLLIVVLAVLAAGAGALAGRWLKPAAPLPPARADLPVLEVGALRPDATLPDSEGRPRSLDEWDGRVVLVNFWASWCAPCREEMPILDDAHARHGGRGLVVVGIAADETAAASDFLAEFPVRYPILIDDPAVGEDVSTRFGNNRGVLPYTVLVGRDRRVLATHFGNFSAEALEDWLAPHLD
ncbi:MAG: TlpA family protein disulfide reductase [Xanthomonadales bacterium]|nr:TlpA family protein disulfide reductase [Xanthomonadales bacterium]